MSQPNPSMVYLLFLFTISCLSFFLIRKNYQLNSLLLITAMGQICWVGYRLLVQRNLSPISFLTIATIILIIIIMIKIIVAFFKNNSMNITNSKEIISEFLETIYKKPFIYLHESLLKIFGYTKIVHFFYKKFEKMEPLNINVIFFFVILLPIGLTNFFIFYEVLIKERINHIFFFITFNYLCYISLKIILFWITDQYLKKIEETKKNIKGTILEEHFFDKKYIFNELQDLWIPYKNLLFYWNQIAYLDFYNSLITYYRETAFYIYSFNILILYFNFLSIILDLYYFPFFLLLSLIFGFYIYTTRILEIERRKPLLKYFNEK
jgi:hypothetical protein